MPPNSWGYAAWSRQRCAQRSITSRKTPTRSKRLTDSRREHRPRPEPNPQQTPTENCLSDAQARTAQLIYAERDDPASGRPLYGVLPGAEALQGSWDAWLTGADDAKRAARNAAIR